MASTRSTRRVTVSVAALVCGFVVGLAVVWSMNRDDGAARPPTDAASTSTTPEETDDPTPAARAENESALARSISDPRVTESSGLARSTVHPGVLYTHNDRGGLPHVFAVDRSGTRAVLRLDTTMVDWEDATSTPDGRLWVGDIGDNDLVRPYVTVLVTDEPEVLVSADVSAQAIRLGYPDGPHDAEALLVDPRDGRLIIVTKDLDGGRMYAAPVTLSADEVNTLEDIGPAPLNVTGGDFAPDGSSFVLRNQGRGFFYTEVGMEPVVVELPDQPQGESVVYSGDGRHVIVGSEGPDSALLRVPTPLPEG